MLINCGFKPCQSDYYCSYAEYDTFISWTGLARSPIWIILIHTYPIYVCHTTIPWHATTTDVMLSVGQFCGQTISTQQFLVQHFGQHRPWLLVLGCIPIIFTCVPFLDVYTCSHTSIILYSQVFSMFVVGCCWYLAAWIDSWSSSDSSSGGNYANRIRSESRTQLLLQVTVTLQESVQGTPKQKSKFSLWPHHGLLWYVLYRMTLIDHDWWTMMDHQ